MSKQKPVCEDGARWIKTQGELGRIPGGKSVLAPFTGQDYAAFKTFVHGLELYTVCDMQGREHALLSMRHAVLAMQPELRWIARETIPFQLDWGTRTTLWPAIMGEECPEFIPTPEQREKCPYCKLGIPRIPSSVTEQFIHMSDVGRVLCKAPGLQKDVFGRLVDGVA